MFSSNVLANLNLELEQMHKIDESTHSTGASDLVSLEEQMVKFGVLGDTERETLSKLGVRLSPVSLEFSCDVTKDQYLNTPYQT